MHLNLPATIFVENDWTLLGRVILANENATDLKKLTLAALIHSGRNLWELPVFWTTPLQEGMLDSDNDSVLFHHLVDFANKMDFTKVDFHNAHVLFPTMAYVSPTPEEIREAKVIAHLITRQRRHWQVSNEQRLEERESAGIQDLNKLATISMQ